MKVYYQDKKCEIKTYGYVPLEEIIKGLENQLGIIIIVYENCPKCNKMLFSNHNDTEFYCDCGYRKTVISGDKEK